MICYNVYYVVAPHGSLDRRHPREMRVTPLEMSSSTSFQKLILNPVLVVADLHVNSRNVELPTADPPGDDACQLPDSVDLANQRTAPVALNIRRVFNLLSFILYSGMCHNC